MWKFANFLLFFWWKFSHFELQIFNHSRWIDSIMASVAHCKCLFRMNFNDVKKSLPSQFAIFIIRTLKNDFFSFPTQHCVWWNFLLFFALLWGWIFLFFIFLFMGAAYTRELTGERKFCDCAKKWICLDVCWVDVKKFVVVIFLQFSLFLTLSVRILFFVREKFLFSIKFSLSILKMWISFIEYFGSVP